MSDEDGKAVRSENETNGSSGMKPRRSARLLNKPENSASSGASSVSGKRAMKRGNEEDEGDEDEEEDKKSTSNKIITRNNRNNRARITEADQKGITSDSSTTTVRFGDNQFEPVATSGPVPETPTSWPDPPTTTNTDDISTNVGMPMFSISIGFGPLPTSSSSINHSAPSIRRMLQSLTGSAPRSFRTGLSGISGVSGFSIPIPIGVVVEDVQPGDASGNNGELIELARQMFQIISGQSRDVESQREEEELSTTFTADLETLLNDFFTRIFASSTPVGLSSDRITQLPETPSNLSEIDCSICRETAKTADEKCVELPCKHSFHFECIEPWLKRVPSCPICRKIIE